MNPYALIRKIIVAAITGNLPDEYRDDAVSILTQSLNSPDEDIRALSVIGLNELSSSSPSVLNALTGAIADSSENVRKRAIRSIGEYGTNALPSLPHLISALDDSNCCIRMEAMSTLGRIGPGAKAAISDLIPLLGDADSRVRAVASSTIRRIGRASIPYLIEALTDPDSLIREQSVRLLGKFRIADDAIIEAIFEACSDFDHDVRREARRVLELLEA